MPTRGLSPLPALKLPTRGQSPLPIRRTQTSARPDLSSTRALLPRNSLTWPSVWCAATNLIGRSFAVRYHGILILNAGASHLSRASLGWQMKQNVVSLARSKMRRRKRSFRRKGAKRGEAGRKAPHKSKRSLFCVSRSDLLNLSSQTLQHYPNLTAVHRS